ncbi:hypothetical protein [Rhizobium phage RHEph16]|uniref:Uncharacterized protein n=1 Tax=Rhizobium phage RHEph16 TaxID=2836132 RepID=A0AAE8AWI2_9CAUD|nr:hypothetical protein PP750_gp08 [Rhizobium phage RHEph16]QXV74317.1 hypothetical protein [Rhizobium phage RHEph16]
MSESRLRYLSPIFYRGEVPFDCTINVYREHDCVTLCKSRHSYHSMALLEPTKHWGELQYRIKVKVKHVAS